MAFFNFDLFGVYFAPMAFVLLLCGLAWLFLRELIDALGLLPLFWHPALLFAGLYAVMASSVVLLLTHDPLVVWQLLGVSR